MVLDLSKGFSPISFKSFLLVILTLSTNRIVQSNNNTRTNGVESSGGKMKPCETLTNKIVGKVYSLQHDDIRSIRKTLMQVKILVNYGQYVGYPRKDGTFEIDGLPSDSYVVEVTHPKYIYEPMRVDITSKGKIRARRVNYIQPSLVQTMEYPLVFRPKNRHNYFVPRETWRIMDLILNPMVIMMVVPLVIIWLLPKMMTPQEVQNQRDNMQMPEYNVPELSEMMATMFGRQGAPGGQNNNVGNAGREAITSSGGSSSSRHGNKAKRR